MRLIDADEIKYREQLEWFGNGRYEPVQFVYESDIDIQPTVDAVPVTQCKDCVNCRKSTLAGRTWKHCAFIGNVVYDDNYCCWAERKDE